MREPNLMGRVTDKECSDWQLTEDSCRSPLYERMAAMVGIRLTSLRVHRRKAVVEISLPVSSRSSSSADDPQQPFGLFAPMTGVQRLPSFAPRSFVHGAWREAVIDPGARPPASMTGPGGAAAIRPRRQPLAPSTGGRMSATRSSDLMVSTHQRHPICRTRRLKAASRTGTTANRRARAARQGYAEPPRERPPAATVLANSLPIFGDPSSCGFCRVGSRWASILRGSLGRASRGYTLALAAFGVDPLLTSCTGVADEQKD